MNSTTPTFFNVEIPKPLPRLCQISQFLKMNPEYSVMTLLGVTLAMALPLLFYIWKKSIVYILKDLKKADILQINGTIMVGVLILLTLGTTQSSPAFGEIPRSPLLVGLITASIIFPFAVSSIFAECRRRYLHRN